MTDVNEAVEENPVDGADVADEEVSETEGGTTDTDTAAA